MVALYISIIVISLLIASFVSFKAYYYGRYSDDVEIKGIESFKKVNTSFALQLKVFAYEITRALFVIISVSSLFILCNREFPKDDFIKMLVIFNACLLLVVLLFVQYLPYAIAKRQVLKDVVRIHKISFVVLYPLLLTLKSIHLIFHEQIEEEDKIDEDVVNEMVDSFEEEGTLEEDEAEMVRGAIDLHNISADEIMTARVDLTAIDIDEPIEEVIKNEELFSHSRIPIYKETLDHIIGILPVKSLYRAYLEEKRIDNLEQYCYQPLFVSSSYPIIELLKDFKNAKVHIAVVLDEYGGTKGIVTMEDILEEIVGDIFDETDEVVEEVKEKGIDDYIIDGSMGIDDFYNELDIEEEYEGRFKTVSGFCQELLGRFPNKGDVLYFKNYQIKILSMDGYVVDKLEVKKIEEYDD